MSLGDYTPQQIEEILQAFFDVAGTRQYIGARYVPIFGRGRGTSVDWDEGADAYEPLSIVYWQGDTYTSRRYVPKGIDIQNGDYWVITGRYNAQIEQYRQEVYAYSDRIDGAYAAVDALREDISDDFVPFPDAQAHPKYGTVGQVLGTLGDGGTQWVDPVTITEDVAEPIIEGWLDAHPEATTTVQDGAITTAKLADGSVTNAKLAQSGGVLTALGDITGNPLLMFEDGFITTNGSTVDVSDITYVDTWMHAIANCSEGDIFTINGTGSGSARLWCFVDALGNVLSVESANTTRTDYELVAPQNARSLIVNSSTRGVCYYGTLARKVILQVPKIHAEIRRDLALVLSFSENLYDKDTALHAYITSDGSIEASETYRTNSTPIYVTRGQKVAITAYCRMLAFYSYTDQMLQFAIYNTATDTHVVTAPDDGYLLIGVYASYVDTFVAVYGDTVPTSYIAYKKTLANDVDFNNDQITLIETLIASSPNTGNILQGKKWVACGDSFTHGDFTNSPTDDYTFDSGLYAGEYKVYPFWIGRRNAMTIVNEAQNGSTMADTGSATLSFANTRYQNIASDADYITLYFGINDSEQSITIGSDDSTDTSTFWGAWNVTLNYIIRNHPQAHIGIIVPNRASTTYCDVVRAAARKWGLPFLDLSAGEQVPLVLYAQGKTSTVDSGIANFRNDQWLVRNSSQGGNFHPNAKAHEYESTFIENWLRTL